MNRYQKAEDRFRRYVDQRDEDAFKSIPTRKRSYVTTSELHRRIGIAAQRSQLTELQKAWALSQARGQRPFLSQTNTTERGG